MVETFDFKGRHIVITGAGGGVGRSLVAHFATLGARVTGCDTSAEAMEGLALDRHEIFDLADAEATTAAAERLCADGAPAVVVSNAGWTRAETLASTDEAALETELAVNFRGAVTLTGRCRQAMREEGEGGAFVFVASVNALAHFGNPAYAAAKAALLAWMRAIATEEGVHGIRANAVAPGSIRTGAWEHRLAKDPAIIQRVAALYPLGRLVEPDEVARAVVFLASDWAEGITGVTLPVDAGLTGGNLPFLSQIDH